MVAAGTTNPTSLRIPAQGRLTREDAEVLHDLLTGQPDTGTWAGDLEAAIAKLSGTRHAVAVASSSTAVSLVLRSLGLRPDDQVIVPAYGSVAIAEAVQSLGASPVPVDVESDSLHVDPAQVARTMTSHTKAVVTVAACGVAVDPEPVLNLVAPVGGQLIELTCGLPVRPHAPLPGQIRCFSTDAYGSNPLNSGALIALNDSATAEQLRARLGRGATGVESPAALHMAEGMSETAAAWQLAMLPRLRGDWLRRCELAMNYSAAFSSRRETEEPLEPDDARPGWHDYALRLNLHHLAESRDELARRLQRRGIPAAVRWLPVILSPVWQQRLGVSPENYPVARNEFLRELCLPLHASLTDDEVETVIDTVIDELDAIAALGGMTQPLRRA